MLARTQPNPDEAVLWDVPRYEPFRRLAAVLGYQDWPWAPDVAPPLGHWLLFLPTEPTLELREDGHPPRLGLPAQSTLPRRMWAGSRITWHGPLQLDAPTQRRSRTITTSAKCGNSGDLLFVTQEHQVYCDGNLAIVEEQDLVFRRPAQAGDPPARRLAPQHRPYRAQRRCVLGPTDLFRYSALTFNAHRIHYDAAYARTEGFSGPVAQGPLLATMVLDLVRQEHPDQEISSYAFRIHKPVLAGETILAGVAGEDRRLVACIEDAQGDVCLSAEVELAA